MRFDQVVDRISTQPAHIHINKMYTNVYVVLVARELPLQRSLCFENAMKFGLPFFF